MTDKIHSILYIIFLKIKYKKKIKIGKNVIFRKGTIITIRSKGMLIIENNVFFNRNCSIICHNHIHIKSNNSFGEFVTIYDHNHKFNNKEKWLEGFTSKPIVINQFNWFGSKCTILPNTRIGKHNVFGANMVINGTYGDNTKYFFPRNAIMSEEIYFKDLR